jgi:hypothetical protein
MSGIAAALGVGGGGGGGGEGGPPHAAAVDNRPVGVVESVDTVERIARVRWLPASAIGMDATQGSSADGFPQPEALQEAGFYMYTRFPFSKTSGQARVSGYT